jgi:hypothetical protein
VAAPASQEVPGPLRFRDMSRESYKTVHEKWPRADCQGGVQLVLVEVESFRLFSRHLCGNPVT